MPAQCTYKCACFGYHCTKTKFQSIFPERVHFFGLYITSKYLTKKYLKIFKKNIWKRLKIREMTIRGKIVNILKKKKFRNLIFFFAKNLPRLMLTNIYWGFRGLSAPVSSENARQTDRRHFFPHAPYRQWNTSPQLASLAEGDKIIFRLNPNIGSNFYIKFTLFSCWSYFHEKNI